MFQLPRTEWIFLAAITTLTAVLAAKLFWTGLFRVYRAFAAFLVISVVRVVALTMMTPNAAEYVTFYIVTESIQLILYILIVMELYGLIFRQYPGIRTGSQWALGSALMASMVVAFLSLSPDMGARLARGTAFDQLMVAERGIVSSMVLLILLVTAFLAWYPVRLPHNLVVHSGVFAVYFLSKSALILYRNLTGVAADRTISLVVMGLAGLCLCLWIVKLQRIGETSTVVVGRLSDREEEERLIAQLKGVNSALARMTRE